MKKKRKLQTFENVIILPGMLERILAEAHDYAEHCQYDLANERFAEALKYTAGDEATLSVYAYSLYEAKEYELAKEVCGQLLELGPVMYVEAMELYLTICMQLRQFQQVEKIIEALLEEGAIPEEQIEKFTRLKDLNTAIAENKRVQEDKAIVQDNYEAVFTIEDFFNKRPAEQLIVIHEMTTMNVRPMAQVLKGIVEHEDTHPFIKSLVLVLLVEQEVQLEVKVQKFERQVVVNPAELVLPTKLPQFQAISAYVIERLEQEPSTLELVQYVIAKHAIVAYPFEWLDYEAEDVATSYIAYVRAMFGKFQEMDSEIQAFIRQLDQWTELQDM